MRRTRSRKASRIERASALPSIRRVSIIPAVLSCRRCCADGAARPSSGEAMNRERVMARDRRDSNPLYNERRLKLGTFCTNLDYGCAMSTIDGTLRISWPDTLALAQLADEM